MNLIYYLSAALFAAGIFALLYFYKDKRLVGNIDVMKAASILCGVLFFVRICSGEFLITDTLGLNIYSPFGAKGNAQVVISTLGLWLIFFAQVTSFTYAFSKEHVPLVSPIFRYGCTAVFLIGIVLMPTLNRAMDGDLADTFHYRSLIFALELGTGLAVSAYELIFGKREKIVGKQWVKVGLIALGMLVVTIPFWAPQALFGPGEENIMALDFNLYHRIMLYSGIVLLVGIHLIFARCDYEKRRYALLYIAVAMMVSYLYDFEFANFTDLTTWPLHICNTALFVIPCILFFRLEKLYYFTIFVNVLGAFFAMIMPDVSETLLSNGHFEFWIGHYVAMLMPLLMMSLKMFQRPKIKQFGYSLIAFTVYFITVLLLNAWLTNYDPDVDFFFINSDFVASKLGGWAEDLRDITKVFTHKELTFIFYPVYQLLYYLVYIVLSFAMWFLYEQAFEIIDTYEIINERNRKIKADRLALEAQLAGRSMQEPIHPENEGKLILRDFSKRYSTSDVYAVYKANLEIEGGQIFGFLGPNGAGKSTIIKTIVGIQTITSGEIEISGYDVNKQSVEAKMQIGFVPDHYALYENLTGREYVNYIADLYNVSKADRDERINDYVSRFRLEGAFDNPMKTYSHGMKQKITIMSALVHNPKIWILDEPLTGLDPESIFQVKECMKEHAAKGNIVFFSSHIIDVVERICDKIAIIRKGQILCVKTIAEIEASGTPLEEFYMGMIDGNTQSPVTVKEAEEASKVVATV